MKKLYLFTLLGVMALSLASCGKNSDTTNPTLPTDSVKPVEPSIKPTQTSKPEVEEISYSIEVIDLDGTVLGSKALKTKDNKSLFNDLKKEFNVKYEDSQYGAMIKSINGSFVDPNYFLALYQNDKAASTGVEGIVLADNDRIKFQSECFNDKLDEIDKKIDLAIYKLLRNAKELYKADADLDMYFMAAMTALVDNGYVEKLDFLPKPYIDAYNAMDINNVEMGQMSKYVLSQKAQGKDLAPLKAIMEKASYTPSNNIWAMAPFYLSTFILDAKLSNKADFIKVFTDFYAKMGQPNSFGGKVGFGDDAAFASQILKTLEGFDAAHFNEVQYQGFKKDGFDAGYGANATSTGLQIMAYSILGMDIRDEAYLVEGKSLIDILFEKYAIDGYTFKNKVADTEADLLFATPQIMAGLVSYKLLRDKGNGEIF